MNRINDFNPNYAVHPGEILEEILNSRNISKTEFAQRCGVSQKKISEIINKKSSLTPNTAIQFESVLGISAETWNNLNAQYSLFLAQQRKARQKQSLINWLKNFPLKVLKDNKILSDITDKEQLAIELLKFFGVASISAWKNLYDKPLAYYRNSNAYKQSIFTLSVWLRLVELEASKIEVRPFNRNKFLNIQKKMRNLTVKSNIDFTEIKKMYQDVGVVFVIEKELPKMRLYGATRWLSSHKVILSLTLRQKTNDQFWFSLFHEAGHILLHDKKRYFMDIENISQDRMEEEANKFANNLLIPENEYHIFIQRKQFYKKDIKEFAEKINIHPAVVVGRLQHEGLIRYNWHNDLKEKIE